MKPATPEDIAILASEFANSEFTSYTHFLEAKASQLRRMVWRAQRVLEDEADE